MSDVILKMTTWRSSFWGWPLARNYEEYVAKVLKRYVSLYKITLLGRFEVSNFVRGFCKRVHNKLHWRGRVQGIGSGKHPQDWYNWDVLAILRDHSVDGPIVCLDGELTAMTAKNYKVVEKLLLIHDALPEHQTPAK